ncbi:hypothetical protein NKH77_23485 [Streptomyces sp. M19]
MLDIDLERERVSLSLKELQPDPFLEFARTRLGAVLTGPVTKAAPFGVFVLLDGEFPGLLPDAVHAVGETVTVRVADINVRDRRVVLSAQKP